MKYEWGNLIIEKRFGVKKRSKSRVQRNTITEYGNIAKLSEKLAKSGREFYERMQNSETKGESVVDTVFNEIISGLDFSLTVPPRVPHEGIDRDIFCEVERRVFERWKEGVSCDIFERNLEVWRQLWITCERCDVIAQIVDARNPNFFINDDVKKLYPNKSHVLLINKADLSRNKQAVNGYVSFYYSVFDSRDLNRFLLKFKNKTIGFVGYPNVGKSSTINLVMDSKMVKTSSTPGKTKHIQTIELDKDTHLLDCPGIVFPRHNKADLILHGVLNVDQLMNLENFLEYIVNFIGINKLCRFYSLNSPCDGFRCSRGLDYMNLMSVERGWGKSVCLKTIVKDFVSGRISYGEDERKT